MLVSVIIPVYNRDVFILETLSSIEKQTYSRWECIIVDDSSIDNTVNEVKNYIKNKERFKLYNRPNNYPKGANSCRNYGFDISKGELINWFDSDDIMHPEFIRLKVEAFLTNDYDLVLSKTTFFKDDITNVLGKETRTNITENIIEDFIMLKSSWYLPDAMWKKSFLKGKQLFSKKLKKGQDRDFHIRMLVYKPKIMVLDYYLTYYRQHEDALTNNYSVNVMKTYVEALNYRIDLLCRNNASKRLKFYLLKTQTKNYQYLYKTKNSFIFFMKVFKKLFVFNIKNIVWVLKFMLAVIMFKLVGKGSFILKD